MKLLFKFLLAGFSILMLIVAFSNIDCNMNISPAPKTERGQGSKSLPNNDMQFKEKQLPFTKQLENDIEKAIKSNQSPKRVWAVAVKKDLNAIVVTIEINDNLTEDMIKYGWLMDAWRVLCVVFDNKTVASNSVIQNVVVKGVFPVVDVYGNKQTKAIALVRLTKKEYLKINKQNFDPQNLSVIAESCQFNPKGVTGSF